MKGKTMIWNYDLTDLVKGYIEKEEFCECTICKKQFEQGRVYDVDGTLYDAKGAARTHVEKEHKSMASYILEQELSVTGITNTQKTILKLMLEGKTDNEIAKETGTTNSTVRNHRYKLREKEKQAKMFLALIASLEKETNRNIDISDLGKIEEHHVSATMVDDRYNITEKERKQVIATYFDDNGGLKEIPAKAKRKIIVLGEILKNFKPDTKYSEKEINKVLKRIYETDYISIRRALIEYGFMDRSDDCAYYQIKQ